MLLVTGLWDQLMIHLRVLASRGHVRLTRVGRLTLAHPRGADATPVDVSRCLRGERRLRVVDHVLAAPGGLTQQGLGAHGPWTVAEDEETRYVGDMLAFVVALLDVIPMIGATLGAVIVTAAASATTVIAARSIAHIQNRSIGRSKSVSSATLKTRVLAVLVR